MLEVLSDQIGDGCPGGCDMAKPQREQVRHMHQ